ncbi:MAG: hypothetical protein AAGI34_06030 [Pseudomonadota bacterium]
MIRGTALVLLALALVVLVVDLWPLLGGTSWQELRFTTLGEVWFRIDPDSYQLLDPAITRHVSVALWDYVVFPLLTESLALELGVLGVLLLLLSRRAKRRSSRQRESLNLKRR